RWGRRARRNAGTRRWAPHDPARCRHDFSCRKDAAMNNALNRMIFPAVSLLSIAAASLLLTACSEPPAQAATVKPVFVTTVKSADSGQTRSFTSVIRARVETELGFRTG